MQVHIVARPPPFSDHEFAAILRIQAPRPSIFKNPVDIEHTFDYRHACRLGEAPA